VKPVALVLLALLAQPLRAQRLAGSQPRVTFPDATTGDSAFTFPGQGAFATDGIGRPWQRIVASVLVPGSGQLMARQPRGIVYLAVEAWAVARAITLDRRGNERAAQYRDLAFEVARRSFTSVRVDGPFEYYETMQKFVESGAFDLDPGAALAPETDDRTYNGSVWLLARRTYFVHPDSIPAPDSPSYLAAIAFYRRRAVNDQFRWSWRNARLEQDVFASQIRAADVALQQRTNYLGLLVLNHLTSAVDAVISARLGRRPQFAPRVTFTGPTGTDLGLSWQASF
jgi:hypothetical protein